jgi:hypothetical protein
MRIIQIIARCGHVIYNEEEFRNSDRKTHAKTGRTMKHLLHKIRKLILTVSSGVLVLLILTEVVYAD